MIVSGPRHKLLALAVFAALSPLAQAQDTPATPTTTTGESADDKPKTLDSIVVTAQKREEGLQDVPIMVTALSEETLQDNGIRDVKDLQLLVPGLIVTSTQSDAQTTARIRGIGTVGDNAGLESSVGVVIDGVYRPRNGVGFGDLGELERIEVLKGPQGTLFGKNTSAGVINVITRRPSFETTADAELTFGNYDAIGVSAAFNTALGEHTAGRIYATKRTRDGFMDVRTGAGPRVEQDDSDQNFHSLRGQILWAPGDDFDINFTADYTSREENCCTGATVVRGLTGDIVNRLSPDEGVVLAADPYNRVAYSNRSTEQDMKDKGVSAEANWQTPWFGGAKLTSVTAVRDWQAISGLDFDFSSADILYRNANEDESFTGFETFSQELRLTGSTDRIDWLVGAFYSDEDLDRNETYRIGSQYGEYLSSAILTSINPAFRNAPSSNTFLQETTRPAGSRLPYSALFGDLAADDRYRQNAKSLALFTNNTFHATDAFDITLGLRYTSEDKELDSQFSNPTGGAACASYFDPAYGGQAGAVGRIAAALTARGVPFASLPAATQQTIISNVIGFTCLPWANPAHNVASRDTRQEREEKEWSGTLKGAYRWNEQVMTYVSAARGYKAGGFNLDRVQSSTGLSGGGTGIVAVRDTSFPGEFVDSYELGAKTTWAGGNLLLNATLFHQTYDDFQLNSFLGTSFVVRSIPEVTSKGIDSEILWQPLDGLLLQGGVTYADTEYGDEQPTADFLPTPASSPGALYKLPGSQVSFAPEWSASAAVAYEWKLGGDLVARFNVGAKYMSEYSTGSDLDPEKMQDAFTVLNARIGFGRADKRWMLELWGQNVTDEDYAQVGFDAPLQNINAVPGNPLNSYNAFLGAPATYGVTLRVSY